MWIHVILLTISIRVASMALEQSYMWVKWLDTKRYFLQYTVDVKTNNSMKGKTVR